MAPETTRDTSPSFAICSAFATFPSGSTSVDVKVVQMLASPRYTQSTSQPRFSTQVDAVPMLVIRMNDAVGADVGRALGARDVGALLGIGCGAELGFGVSAGVGTGVVGTGVGAGVGTGVVGTGVGAGLNET